MSLLMIPSSAVVPVTKKIGNLSMYELVNVLTDRMAQNMCTAVARIAAVSSRDPDTSLRQDPPVLAKKHSLRCPKYNTRKKFTFSTMHLNKETVHEHLLQKEKLLESKTKAKYSGNMSTTRNGRWLSQNMQTLSISADKNTDSPIRHV
uniref:SFRICE_012981 n=1 Tax=Spodoptera frugiperda TaxID=7108 RepID=A0A2H1WHD4_SPOFR